MAEICSDNRFEMIKWFKERLIERTNIETSPEEMAVIDGILFRFWQLGWLDVLFSNEMEDKKKLQEKEGDMTREVQIDSMAKATTPNKNEQAFICFGAKWADSHPHWIPVEEELPELTIDDWRSEDVFFATDDCKSHFGFYSNKGVWFSSVYGFNGHQVTHWMPLPVAPRKEE